jgi:hypothetical protein
MSEVETTAVKPRTPVAKIDAAAEKAYAEAPPSPVEGPRLKRPAKTAAPKKAAPAAKPRRAPAKKAPAVKKTAPPRSCRQEGCRAEEGRLLPKKAAAPCEGRQEARLPPKPTLSSSSRIPS